MSRSDTGDQGKPREGEQGPEGVAGTGLRPLRSRLRPPRSHLPLVERDDLIAALAQTNAPLILVSAPAGAGKTTLLAQFAGADDRPAAWVQLDEADNDPIVLLTYLAHALDGVSPVDPEVFERLQVRTPPVDQVILPGLEDALARAPAFLLVLDDAHLLRSGECWRLLAFVLDHLPEGSHVLIGTRTDPPLPLARLHAEGRVTEYRMVDLALTRDEAGRLLELYGRADDGELDELLRRTEGWVTGLCLALMAGDGRPPEELPNDVHGGRREIAAYLIGEVLERQPERVQQFLLRTSVLDALSADLCRVVSRYEDADRVLVALANENVFITALGERDEWYRYHHLFAEMLRLQLDRRDPAGAAEVHHAAAQWYAGHDMVDQAVRHWLAADEAANAVGSAAYACFELVDHGQVESARLLLERFSDAQLEAYVPLTLAACYVFGMVLDDPRRGEHWRRAACVARPDDTPKADGGSWHELQLTMRAFLAPDGVKAMLADARLALEVARSYPLDVQGEVKHTVGVAEYLSGHPARARRAFTDTVADVGVPGSEAYARSFLSLIAGDEGRWDEAERLDATALERCPTMTLDISPGMYLAMPMLLAHTRLLAHLGAESCADWRARTEAYLEAMVPQVAWRIMLIAVVLGEIALELGDVADAARWSSRAEEALRTCPDPGALAARIKRLGELVEQRRVADPLTAAERRVLELLPTQLTAEQMAQRLFVSVNTVKSHHRHLYTKLGVTTRTAAVQRARDLGLLPSGQP